MPILSYQSDKILTLPKGQPVAVLAFVTMRDAPPSVGTSAFVTWTDEGLSVEFECEGAAEVAKERPRNDPEAWRDDCVELYLDPGHTHDDAGRWRHFLVTAAGCINEQENRNRDFRAPGLRTHVERTATGWRAGMFLPWRDAGGTPSVGDVWGFNLNRAVYPRNEHLCFSPTRTTHSNLHNWGHIVFADEHGNAGGGAAVLKAVHDRLDREIQQGARDKALTENPFPNSSPGTKTRSTFLSPDALDAVRRNADAIEWVARARDRIVEHARPWMEMDDDALWGLMYGATLTRAWTVNTHGVCPTCKAQIVMYNWKADAIRHPWKVQCPQCDAQFPTNDFAAFYRSGLDKHGIFDGALADRDLLFNAAHPGKEDPLRSFGVDDGEGYVEGDQRWRFISLYLVAGQWRQAVMAGVQALSAAYAVTGDVVYARKAGIVLDRVADLYPSFDYQTQGEVYETKRIANGYVTMWHDACEETKQLALAYDRVFDAIKNDTALVEFLAEKARRYGIENPKATFADVQRNIEGGILCDALNHYAKIFSNFPRVQLTQAIIKATLSWETDRDQVIEHITRYVQCGTAFDGVTGEKGLPTYAAYVIRDMAEGLACFAKIDPRFLADVVKQCPDLRKTFRFYVDTHCLGRYFPEIGDAGFFARTVENFVGASFPRHDQATQQAEQIHVPAFVQPSSYELFWQLYELTGDAELVRVLYRANDRRVDALPQDLWANNPAEFQRKVAAVIREAGEESDPGSVNKEAWCLAVMRSGAGDRARAVWLDYDTGGSHGHQDAMNLGLYAFGLDLMPDFGYPPLQFDPARVNWYRSTVGHNTVAVEGEDQKGHYLSHRWDGFRRGKTTMWINDGLVRAIRVSGPEIIDGAQYERTICSVDISADDFYIVDIFRVVGGREHTKFMHSHFGTISTSGLSLKPTADYGHTAPMRNTRGEASAKPGWSADWAIDDRRGVLKRAADIHLRYTDLTRDAEAQICEAWIVAGSYNSLDEAWIPRVLVRRRTDEDKPLASNFVGIIEPYEGKSNIVSIRRLTLTTPDGESYGDGAVALEVQLLDGSKDLILAVDTENPLGVRPDWRVVRQARQPDWDVQTDADFLWLRRTADGRVLRVSAGA